MDKIVEDRERKMQWPETESAENATNKAQTAKERKAKPRQGKGEETERKGTKIFPEAEKRIKESKSAGDNI